MARVEIATLKGPQGRTGPRGFPGAADVPTDPALAEILSAADSETFAAAEVSLQAFGRHIHGGYRMSDRWRPVVDRVLSREGSATVLCLGDSTVWGTGSSGEYSNRFAWPAEMARNMNRALALTTHGLSIPPSDNRPDSDPRWTLGAGWAQAPEGGVGLGGRHSVYKGVAGGGGTLHFLDPRINANRYDIYYLTNQSPTQGGEFTAWSGAGTPLVVSSHTPGGNGMAKATVIAPSSSSTGITIQNTGSQGNVWIVGIEPYAQGESRFRVGNAGAAASDTSSWLAQNGGSNAWNVRAFLPLYEPDLTIIDLGINDAGNDVSVSSYISRMQTLADAAYAAGSAVLLKTMIPSDGAARFAREAEYVQALKTQLSPAYPILDLFNHYGSWERTNARGWMADWGHGTDGMYADEGALVAEMLFRYSGHGG